jgi:murein DD-endopeptidase MepM/ murein hydrolase activator NlpD
MRWLFCLAATAAWAQTFTATPRVVPQGDTLRINGTGNAFAARLNDRTIRLFPQKEGGWLGLMPVHVTATPGVYTLELLDSQGATLETSSITIQDAHYPTQNIVISKSLSELRATPDEVETTAAFRKEVLDTRYWTEPLLAPIDGCLTSPFGVRRLHNGKPTGDYHGGLDQRAAAGSPIRAVAAGVVKIARPFQLHGGTVGIDHGQGLESMYLHMSRVAATEGASVQRGDVIGYVGATGRATGPHLHWSLYVSGVAVNPLQWVKLSPCSRTVKTPRKKRHRP